MSPDQLTAERIEINGRTTTFRVGGDGPPVLFLHGWGLGTRAYQRVVRRLTRRGCRVYAPAMPGFGGSADLPADALTIDGYGEWLDQFMQAVHIDEPALVIGHSFGGGVAIKLAQSHPDRVAYLVLLNSVGGVTDRPIWAWMLQFARELFPNRQGIEIALAMRDDLVSNLVRNPLGLIRAGHLARTADLRAELAELQARGVPVLALTTDADGVIPRDAFEALCNAVGAEGHILSGRHSWLLTEPDSFDAVLANIVEVRVDQHQERTASTRAAQVLDALRTTSIPIRHVRNLLRDAPPLWLLSAPTDLLAADLALCHPELADGEVRAVAREIDGSAAVRLTVAAEDRKGLLADTTAVLARHGLTIVDASAATWTKQGLALHALTIGHEPGFDAAEWERLGDDLRRIGHGAPAPRVRFTPTKRAHVMTDGGNEDRTLVRVIARDQVGLLATICRYFSDRGVSVESVHAATDGETARDVFVVTGPCCADDLARRLSPR